MRQPPRQKPPLTSSLIKGMRNTNQNIGNSNIPGGQANYLTPPNQFSSHLSYGNQNQGPGAGDFFTGGSGAIGTGGMANWKSDFDLGGQDPGMPTDELPEGWEWQMVGGNWEPVSSAGTELAPPSYLQETPKTHDAFDVNNDGVVDILDITATSQMSPTEWAHSTGTGGFNFQDYQDLMYQGFLDAGNWNFDHSYTVSDWWDALHPDSQYTMEYGYSYGPAQGQQWGYGGSDEGMASWQIDNPALGWDWVPGEQWNPDWANQAPPYWEDPQVDTTGAYYDPVASAQHQQGFLEDLMNYINA